MKIGDKLAVFIEGIEVTRGEIASISNGQVEIIIPGTRVVMATRTELAPHETKAPEVEHQVIGTTDVSDVNATSDTGPVAEPVEPVVEPVAQAPVVEATPDVKPAE